MCVAFLKKVEFKVHFGEKKDNCQGNVGFEVTMCNFAVKLSVVFFNGNHRML